MPALPHQLAESIADPLAREMFLIAGVAAIYGPGTHIPTAAREILGIIRARNSR